MSTVVSPHPPGAWRPARTAAQRVAAPFQRFLHVEAASGLVLAFVTVAALVWANWPGESGYEAFLHVPLGVRAGAFEFVRPLHFWIDDGLMTLFFLLVGLEVRAEIHDGELSSLRRAALPLFAALGGMVVPASIYLAINAHGAGAPRGWGVPMATDIAFAVGVVTLLGRRVSPTVRVLLLALAVIDDIGAVLVIALFYSEHFALVGLSIAAGGAALVVALRLLGVRWTPAYAAGGALLWVGFLRAGVHPTMAGVVLGLLTPARAWYGRRGFVDTAREVADAAESTDTPGALMGLLDRLQRARREAVPPLAFLRARLHHVVAFLIMPAFALGNAGVRLGGADLAAAPATSVAIGVFLGLLVGKPLGIVALSLAAVKARIAVMPEGLGPRDLALLGVVASIGFTMSIFIADLAFPEPALLHAAKLAVLAAALGSIVLTAASRVLARIRPAGALGRPAGL